MSLVLAASVFRTIGIVIALIVVAGFAIYALVNVRAGREEAGAEIELAANRKPYYDDDELEGPRLDRSLGFGLVTLAIIGVGLPLYWLGEPSRQENAQGDFDRVFVDRGSELFEERCAVCHGPEGVGGVTSQPILDEETNEFIAQVNWQAPALDTAMLRFSEDEVTYILDHGRPASPMPAWGEPGGGPLTTQEIEYLVDYLDSIKLSSEEATTAAAEQLALELGLAEPDASDEELAAAVEQIDYDDLATGEALFNLGRESGFAGGAYACGRCHTQGWSYSPAPGEANVVTDADGTEQVGGPAARAALQERVDAPDGSGAFGPNLRDGVTERQFPTFEGHAEFVTAGSVDGEAYGRSGQGDGLMPGFGDDPDTETAGDGMLTPEMIAAIVEYERSL